MTALANQLARPAGFRIGTILRSSDVTARMRRVTIGVPDLRDFDCPPAALGPHVHLLLPRQDLAEQAWPVADEAGRAVYPPPETRPILRTYSVRDFHYGQGSIDVDIVLHGDGGHGSRWAMRAAPGEEVGLWRPHARILDHAPSRYLFAGDETALPAIAFILARLPQDAVGTALIEVRDESDHQVLDRPPGIRLRWLHRGEALPGTTTHLIDAVREEGMAPADFVWVGAEAAAARAIRRFARADRRLPAEQAYILNYWKRGVVEGEFDHGE